MKKTIDELMLYAVASTAVIAIVAVAAFACGTLMGFGAMIARVAFRLWGV